MKRSLLASAVVVIAIAASGSAVASATHAAGAAPCTPKLTKIQGKSAVVGCGPATASVTVAGKTYSFKDGLCTVSGKKAFLLQLGTVVSESDTNGGLPSLEITATGSNAILAGFYKGKKIIPVADFLVTAKNAGKNTGTFAARPGGTKLAGAWNCHGVIFKG